jgi:hypothetical protein
MDIIWALVGFVVTLLVFSYILGDNPLFRIAAYIFVGVSAAYAALLVIYQVLLPRLVQPLFQGSYLLIIPLLLGVLLIAKLFPRFSKVGSLSMAYLVGAAAGVAIGGALLTTLLGQMQGAINEFDLVSAARQQGNTPLMQIVEGFFLLVGTVTTLAYFQFGARKRPDQSPRRNPWIDSLAQIGQVFIAITLGALFAGVFSAALAALVERLDFLIQFILSLVK